MTGWTEFTGTLTERQNAIRQLYLDAGVQVLGAEPDLRFALPMYVSGPHIMPLDALHDVSLRNSVILNARYLADDQIDDGTRRVWHESGHARVIRRLDELYDPEKIEALTNSSVERRIAWDSGEYICEEMRADNLVASLINGYWDKRSAELNTEGKYFSTTTEGIVRQFGRYPLFMQFFDAVIRRWATGSPGKDLHPDVAITFSEVNRVMRWCSYLRQDITEPQNEEETRKWARETINLYDEKAWPEIEKLVKKDMEHEEKRQVANQYMKTLQQLKSKQQQLHQLSGDDATGKREQLEKEIQGLHDKIEQIGGNIDPNLLKELEEAFERATAKSMHQLQQILERLNQEREKIQQERDKIRQDLLKGDESGTGQRDQLLHEGEQLDRLLNEIEKISGGLEKELLDLLSGKSENGSPLETDTLSNDLNQELEQMFNGLPQNIRDQIMEQSIKQLREAIEKMLGEGEESEEEDGKDSNTENIDRKSDAKGDDADDIQQILAKHGIPNKAPIPADEEDGEQPGDKVGKEPMGVSQELITVPPEALPIQLGQQAPTKRMRPEDATEWENDEACPEFDEMVSTQAEAIATLTSHLLYLTTLDPYDEEDQGYPTGMAFEDARLLASGMDPKLMLQVAVRDVDYLSDREINVWHAVDTSSSMISIFTDTIQSVIVPMVAVDYVTNPPVEHLRILQGMSTFDNGVCQVMPLSSHLTSKAKNAIARVRANENGGTNTLDAVNHAFVRLQENMGKTLNAALIYTDGMPNKDIQLRLKSKLKGDRQTKKTQKLKVGCIWVGGSLSEELFLGNLYHIVNEVASTETKAKYYDLGKSIGWDMAMMRFLVEVFGYDFGVHMGDVSDEEGLAYANIMGEIFLSLVMNGSLDQGTISEEVLEHIVINDQYKEE